MSGLSQRDVEILQLEREWWKQAGAKEQAIRTLFDCSATTYYQRLNRLLDDPAALEHDPVTVHRLRRIRDQRLARRGTGQRQRMSTRSGAQRRVGDGPTITASM